MSITFWLWISRKYWQREQTLLLLTNRQLHKAFPSDERYQSPRFQRCKEWRWTTFRQDMSRGVCLLPDFKQHATQCILAYFIHSVCPYVCVCVCMCVCVCVCSSIWKRHCSIAWIQFEINPPLYMFSQSKCYLSWPWVL